MSGTDTAICSTDVVSAYTVCGTGIACYAACGTDMPCGYARRHRQNSTSSLTGSDGYDRQRALNIACTKCGPDVPYDATRMMIDHAREAHEEEEKQNLKGALFRMRRVLLQHAALWPTLLRGARY